MGLLRSSMPLGSIQGSWTSRSSCLCQAFCAHVSLRREICACSGIAHRLKPVFCEAALNLPDLDVCAIDTRPIVPLFQSGQPFLGFPVPSTTSHVQARFTWVYLTQHLPFSRFLTSSRVYVLHSFTTLFHAAAAHGIRCAFKAFPVDGSRSCLQPDTLLTLQDNLNFDKAWLVRLLTGSRMDLVQHLAVPLPV